MAKPKTTIRRNKRIPLAPATCYFCTEKKEPMYMETNDLQKFLSDRGKIMSRSRNGLCAKHQHRFSDAVKYSRHLALLPFVVRD